jgi:hypothetical protein
VFARHIGTNGTEPLSTDWRAGNPLATATRGNADVTTSTTATLFVLVFAWPSLVAAQQAPNQPTTAPAEASPSQQTSNQKTAPKDSSSQDWYVEYSLSGGTITAKHEIAVNHNATGDHEQLFARLKSSPFVGGRVGVHGKWLGIEAGVFRTTEKIQVSNEFGVPFPNHGENITFMKADLLYYPVPRSAFNKVFRPYLSAGLGGNFFSVDTDNINDQENYVNRTASIGGGGKFTLGGKDGKEGNIVFEVLLRYERMFGRSPIQPGGFVMVSAGVAFRQYQEPKP